MLTTIIVPTYNEAPNITQTLDRIQTVLSNHHYEIIVVDDDSPDLTWQLAQRHAATNPHISVLRRHHRHQRGLAASIFHAMTIAKGHTIAVIDADLQHDETILPDLITSIQHGTDIAIATRTNPHTNRPPTRRWLTAAGTTAAGLILPQLRRTTDPLSGYFAISRDIYNHTTPPHHIGRAYKALWHFLTTNTPKTITEHPYHFGPRTHGTSKLTPTTITDDLTLALALRLNNRLTPTTIKHLLAILALALATAALALAKHRTNTLSR